MSRDAGTITFGNRIAVPYLEGMQAAVGWRKTKAYEALRDGTAPKPFRVGKRLMITVTALHEWVRQMEEKYEASTAPTAAHRVSQ